MTRYDSPRGNVLTLRTGYNPHEDLAPKRAARRRRLYSAIMWCVFVLGFALTSAVLWS
jgi:hypothetical protein